MELRWLPAGGGKGGRPDINPNTNEGAEALAMAQQQFNNDGSYGYYNNQGRYVPFLVDAFDGGGITLLILILKALALYLLY